MKKINKFLIAMIIGLMIIPSTYIYNTEYSKYESKKVINTYTVKDIGYASINLTWDFLLGDTTYDETNNRLVYNYNPLFFITLKDDNESEVTYDIYKQEDLDKYLEKTGNDLSGDIINFRNDEDIKFPLDVYTTNTKVVRMNFYASSGNIDFNNSLFVIGSTTINAKVTGDQKNRKISNLTTLGSAVIDASKASTTSYNPITENSSGGNIIFNLFHTSNLNFENMTFNASHGYNTHIFDIMGSNNITLDDIEVHGSPISMDNSQADLLATYNNSAHKIYSEAIQIDATNVGAPGQIELGDGCLEVNKIWCGQEYDKVASKNVTIKNSAFTSYSGITGYALITQNESKKVKLYGSIVGSHSAGTNSGYENITIDNCIFENTIRIDEINSIYLSPIRFYIIAGNKYSSGTTAEEKENIIINSQEYKETKINVKNTKFINTRTTGYDAQNGIRNTASNVIGYYDNDSNPNNNVVSNSIYMYDTLTLKEQQTTIPDSDVEYTFKSFETNLVTLDSNTKTYSIEITGNKGEVVLQDSDGKELDKNNITTNFKLVFSELDIDNKDNIKITLLENVNDNNDVVYNVPNTSKSSKIILTILGIIQFSIGLSLIIFIINNKKLKHNN